MTDSVGQETDVMPVVERSGSGNAGMWIFLCVLLFGGTSLLWAMTTSREAAMVPATLVGPDQGAGRITAPPPLALPRDYSYLPEQRYVIPRPLRTLSPPEPAGRQMAQTAPVQSSSPPPRVIEPGPRFPEEPVRMLPEPLTPFPVNSREDLLPAQVAGGEPGENRVQAFRLRNPAHTVPQGTMVPAVLETALDSTGPGAVRALVQRDIFSFDGSRVLIHRGSRLYGEYDGAVRQGQNRALIRWTRLIRPDGVTMALDSPASDPLGRAGIRARVDSKFLQRFGGAILQSVLDIGVGIATREATNGVIVALPGSTQNVPPRITQSEIRPVLRVRHGTSVSVFVARDLDFSLVDL